MVVGNVAAGQSQLQSGAKPDGVVQDILFGRAVDGEQPNTPDEDKTAKEVMKLYQKARTWRETWAKDHDRWWNMWESNHYKSRIPHTLTQAVVNQIWSSIETFLGHILDGMPEPTARARSPQNKDKAKLITKWLRHERDRTNLDQEAMHPIRAAAVAGAGWFKVDWDETAERGKGDVSIKAIDSKFIFPAPYCRDLGKDCRYVIEAKNVPREAVINQWEKGRLVPPGIMDGTLSNIRAFQQDNRHDAAAPNWQLVTTTTGSESRWTGTGAQAGATSYDMVTLVEMWARQDDGKMRYTVVANGVLLQDGPSPYDDEDFPYAVVNIIPTMDTIQGRGLTQFIEGLQEILNAAVSTMLDQQRFDADPMLIVDTENVEEGQLVDNSPGAVLINSSQRGQGYYWLHGPGYNKGWADVQELISGYMDSVLGRVEVLKGERPAGVTTLGGLEIIRDEANVRLRTLIRWVKASMKRVYLLTLSRLRQFMDDERVLRIVGKNGKEEFVTVNPTISADPTGMPIQDPTIPINSEFDVEFDREIPGGRQSKIELALTLAGMPAEDGLPMVDRQYVLEQAEVDELDEISERMAALAEEQAKAMQAEQAAAQGQPAPEQQGEAEEAISLLMDEGGV